jgi:predicted RND superfamily exporter protein
MLIVPLVLMKPAETASDRPTSNEFVELDNLIRDRFPFELYRILFVAEATDGDILTQSNLYKLYRNEEALRSSELSPLLYERFNSEADIQLKGVFTIADAVNTALELQSGGTVDLSCATDVQVKQALADVLASPLTDDLASQLSVKASYVQGPDGRPMWTSPALHFFVESDYNKVKSEYASVVGRSFSEELAPEYFGRDVQQLLRRDEDGYRLWGVAMDVNLEIADESRISSVMLVAAVALVLAIVAAVFRSVRVTLLCAIGLGMLIIWVKGLSNLVGLNNSIVLDVVLPVAMLVLGIDYAIHSLLRYRDERASGNPPAEAIGRSTNRVGAALVLAMLTTAIAFGSNITSGVESIVGFAIGGCIAIVSAFIILGLFVPTVVARFDLLPINKRYADHTGRPAAARLPFGRTVLLFAGRPAVSLLMVVALTGVCVWGWVSLEPRLNPSEAFDPASDLVVGLSKLDEHGGGRYGESAYIYIEGDLAKHDTLLAIEETVRAVEDNTYLVRDSVNDRADVRAPLLDQLGAVVDSDAARAAIEGQYGVPVSDIDRDSLPDTYEQIRAAYSYMIEHGVPGADGTLLFTPGQVGATFVGSPVAKDATLVRMEVSDTEEHAVAKASADELREDVDSTLGQVTGIDSYGFTGSAYVRAAQFDAITRSMTLSLLVAAVSCLLVLTVWFRSTRYAVATVLPVLVVTCWLHGFMYTAGYHLNLMTATIAAISIGVGIDFSIHLSERFRQEFTVRGTRLEALSATANTTGVALLATAISTAAGFAVIAFAPMPMFSRFGILMAVMIIFALVAALVVLPSLLILLPGNTPGPQSRE